MRKNRAIARATVFGPVELKRTVQQAEKQAILVPVQVDTPLSNDAEMAMVDEDTSLAGIELDSAGGMHSHGKQ
jgi:hypothetical protein